MYFFPLIRFLPKRLTDYVSLRMFVCLFDYYPTRVNIFANCLYCYCQFDFVIQSLLSSIITHQFLFHFFIRPFGEYSRHKVRAAWSTPTRPLYA